MTRDVTAWAYLVGFRRQNVWYRTDSVGNLLPDLGPPRLPQRESAETAFSHRRFDRDCFRRDRTPNGVAWRFPDWTAVGYAVPSPFLGSAPLGIPLPEHSRLFRLDPTIDGRLSLHGDWTTGGDSNPDCLLAAFLRRFPGWPGRWPPTFAVPAFDCFARSFARRKPVSVVRSVLLFRRSLSCPTTEGNIQQRVKNRMSFRQGNFYLSTDARKSLSRKGNRGA